MPILVDLDYSDVNSVEMQYGLKFSNNERLVLSLFAKVQIDVIARFELLKMRSSLERKINYAQKQLGIAEYGSKEHFERLSILSELERKLSEVAERLEIRI